jgi:hypothetical protein
MTHYWPIKSDSKFSRDHYGQILTNKGGDRFIHAAVGGKYTAMTWEDKQNVSILKNLNKLPRAGT